MWFTRERLPLTVLGPPDALRRVAPWIRAHRTRRRVRLVPLGSSWNAASLRRWAEQSVAVVAIGGSGRSPRCAVPGLFIATRTGRRVPVGWLPQRGHALSCYARAAAQVVQRDRRGVRPGPLALLGQWQDRVIEAADAIGRRLAQLGGVEVLHWTADRVVHRDVIRGLAFGPGAAVYFGHAVAGGWIGYGGVKASHLAQPAGEPLGAVLSIACDSAKRAQRGLSFSERLVLGGICCAAVGAVGPTWHLHNRIFGSALCEAIALRCRTLASALHFASPSLQVARRFRILGDPLAPLIGASGCARRSRTIFAPDPSAPLPALPDGIWRGQPVHDPSIHAVN